MLCKRCHVKEDIGDTVFRRIEVTDEHTAATVRAQIVDAIRRLPVEDLDLVAAIVARLTVRV